MDKTTYNKYLDEFSKDEGQTLVDKYLVIKACLFAKGTNLTKLDKQSRKVLIKSAKKQAKEG